MKSLHSLAIAILTIGLTVTFTSDNANAVKKADSRLCERQMNAASVEEGVPLGLLYAIALTETGSGGELNPHALNIEGVSYFAKSTTDALTAFHEARNANKTLIDLGCMQINYHYHHEKFSRVSDMLDPQQNVKYAAKLLKTLKTRHGTWTEAVARYHAGPKNKGAQHRYVCKVLKNLVAMHFGSWTSESKSYCTRKTD